MRKLIFLVLLFGSSCAHKSVKPEGKDYHAKNLLEAKTTTDTLTILLGLTEEQKPLVYADLLKVRDEEVACKPLKKLDNAQYDAQKKEVIHKCYDKMIVYLSPEQKKKLDVYLPTLKCFKNFW